MTVKLHELLGLPDAPKNGLEWHDHVTAGFPTSAIASLAQHLEVEPFQVAELVGSDKRLLRTKTLKPEVSDRLYCVALALRQLQAVKAGDFEACVHWLRHAQPELRNRIPILLLQSRIGAEFVFASIARMKPAATPVPSYDEPAEPSDDGSSED